jgi:hypothetical protein
MSLLERIKNVFSRSSLPEETQLLIAGVRDVDELRLELDKIATRNEVEAREIEREIEKLGKAEEAHKGRITGGTLSEREKLSILREIKRLRRRMDSLERRHRIHQDNIDLHLGLFDRITEMQAMELKKVTQGQIEEITVDYEERLEKHRDIMSVAKAASATEGYEDTRERKELAALEAEILKEAGLVEEPVKVEPVAEEPVAEEPVAEEPAKVEPVAVEPVAVEPVAVEPVADEPAEVAVEPTAGVAARPAIEEALRGVESREREDDERRVELE